MTPKQKTKLQLVLTNAHSDFEKGLNARAFFKLHDHTMSKDMVQETYMKTWAYLIKGGKIDIMKAFLYHVLNCLIIDEYRKQKTTSLELLVEKGFEPGVDSRDKLMTLMDGKAAILLIAHLPETYRKVMRMRFVQDLSISEIALLTGQSKNTIAVQLHRGLQKLRLLYK